MKNIILFLLLLLISTNTPINVLFVGDSLTCYSGGWQQSISKRFNYKYDNLSKPGKRTDWMLQQLKSQLSKNKNYSKVFIYGGCNDAFAYVNLDSSVSNIQKMVDLCNKQKIKPYVIVGYNPEKVMTTTIYDQKTTDFHRKRYVVLQSKMMNLKNCYIIKKDTTVLRKDSGDGIHLNSSGHKKFTDWIINQIINLEN